MEHDLRRLTEVVQDLLHTLTLQPLGELTQFRGFGAPVINSARICDGSDE